MPIISEAFTSGSDGQVSAPERTITAGAGNWDLSDGNYWTCGAIDIPQPTNGLTGQSGVIRLTAAPTSFPAGGALKFAGGSAPAPTSFPAIVPFYVQDASNVLLGTPTEGIA